MYLKSIEIYGFKSFANKIIFEFQNGITGIVGPNGSGKSNVADAVRWVLGEQSARQLRGAKMEDVIFSGTENRKPVGSAYVAITFDNKDKKLPVDYEEVTVARRVYRSGESEYILNGSQCRRRDIVELFMDTGIGKEGYSIIGQGQIEKVLSGKPEDRRELFDEAAGIVKYKKNKEATQKALEAERQNLERVTDILNELSRQLGPLSRQSKTAKEYLSLRDELKSAEARHFIYWNGQLKTAVEGLNGKLQIVKSDLEEKNRLYEETKKEYERIEDRIEELEKAIHDQTEQIHENSLAAEKAEGQIQVLEEQIHTAKVNESHKKSNEERLLSTIQNKEEERANLLLEREGLDQEEEELKERKAEEETALLLIQERIRKINQEISDHQTKTQSLLGEFAGKKVSLNRYEVMEEQLHFRTSQISQKSLEAAGQLERLQDDYLDNEEEGKRTKIELEQVRAELAVLSRKMKENQEEGQKLNRLYQQANEQYQRDRSKLETLRNMAERYDGYGNSIRKVMEKKKETPGIHGVVADIIKVKKEYETAIETALGGSIQNIVTDTEETAKRMIGYLKENRYGRATFLPLSAMRESYFQKQEALSEKGVIGLASDLVTVKPEYKKLVSHLLGRILVLDHIDHAISLARKYGYGFRIVTLEGESLSPGGAMTGGAFRNTSNLLGRQREMEDLKGRMEAEKEQIEKVKDALLKNQTTGKELKEQENQKKDRNQQLLLLENQSVMEESRLKEQMEEQERTMVSLQREKQDIQIQLGEIEKNKSEIRKKQAALASTQEEMTKTEEQLHRKREEETAEQTKVSESMMEITMALTALTQKAAFFEENKKRLEQEIALSQKELEREQRDSYEMKEKQEALSNEILKLRKEIIHYQEAKKENQKEQEQRIQEKEEYLKRNKEFFEKREALSAEINGLDKEEYRLNGRLTKAEQEIEDLKQYMWENYEMTLSKAADFTKTEDPIPFSQLKEKISDLKKQMNSLGPVNVGAIEEYNEVTSRHAFLSEQYTDIQKAESKLLDIIKELDEAMKKQFSQKFKEINEMFHQVFQELFGGGTGTLELIEEDNLLETGIRITAQPPGKKLQNMMQLSGGEKALTAIALLFAIQNLKPSPFCMLDEIEAALDDSNVDRYASYLRKLTKDTQFIVITHRRGTMTAADMLYGITMQEKGVSTLISVDLIEKDLSK
ncbi:MAG: chromosome segregation protein SMC [Lachnospiraceae bacterium]|nr:chromosome segregation protein SMC [Lachnospiraceae bacterium]